MSEEKKQTTDSRQPVGSASLGLSRDRRGRKTADRAPADPALSAAKKKSEPDKGEASKSTPAPVPAAEDSIKSLDEAELGPPEIKIIKPEPVVLPEEGNIEAVKDQIADKNDEETEKAEDNTFEEPALEQKRLKIKSKSALGADIKEKKLAKPKDSEIKPLVVKNIAKPALKTKQTAGNVRPASILRKPMPKTAQVVERRAVDIEANFLKRYQAKLKENLALARKIRVEKRTKNLKQVMEYAYQHQHITNNEVKKITGMKNRTALKYLKILVKQGKLVRFGKTINTFYKPIGK